MAKSIVKLVVTILLIGIVTTVGLVGLDLNINGTHITYPSALDENEGIRRGLDLVGGSIITYEAQAENPTADEMESVASVLRKRLDSLGYSEATVSTQGDKKVRVEIPSIQDPEQAVQTLAVTAKLTFRDADGNVIMEGSDVNRAEAAYGQVEENGPQIHYVSLKLNSDGVSKFADATAKAAERKSEQKNYIGIYLDEQVVSQPYVETAINSDSCVISGGFESREDSSELATLINSGNLPFSIKDVELRSVGPTLGERAFDTSLLAAGIGTVCIFLFMILFYRLPGLMADIALVAYIGIVAWIMGGFRVNLSLPGIAGIILSIGMAVDANVVIFERLKEELRVGKTVRAAVDVGFDRAFMAIVDSNITTLIAAAVLYYFGTGPIQGFAITLGIGTLASMFTAIVITKFLMRALVGLNVKNPALYGVSRRRAQNV